LHIGGTVNISAPIDLTRVFVSFGWPQSSVGRILGIVSKGNTGATHNNHIDVMYSIGSDLEQTCFYLYFILTHLLEKSSSRDFDNNTHYLYRQNPAWMLQLLDAYFLASLGTGAKRIKSEYQDDLCIAHEPYHV